MAKMRREDYEDELAEDKEVREEVSWHATDQKHLKNLKKQLEESASDDEETALEALERQRDKHEALMQILIEDEEAYAEECEIMNRAMHRAQREQ